MKYLLVFVLDFSLLWTLHEEKRRFPYQFYPGSTPYKGLYGAAPPEKCTFFRVKVYEGAWISLVEIYERGRKSVISFCKRPNRAKGYVL